MKIYMRFDEDGTQTEVTTSTTKPTGSEWKAAPGDFDFSKRYRLNDAGKIEEISEDELAAMGFETAKSMALAEISRMIDGARNKYVGESASKRKSHRLQEQAANAVISDASSTLAALISPLAAIRNVSILEMAQLILAKSEIANLKVMKLEAVEDNYEKLIVNAETMEQINQILSEVKTALNGGKN
jgi:hypothetical protein